MMKIFEIVDYKIPDYTIPNRVEKDGDVFHFNDEGKFHRDNDEPAIEYKDGRKEYWKHGERYTPAHILATKPVITKKPSDRGYGLDITITYPNGKVVKGFEDDYAIYYVDNKGRPHSVNDKPGQVNDDGGQIWYKHGKVHRDNDLPAIVHKDGHKEWHKNGIPHRDGDKPALIRANGTQEWIVNGREHRDGNKPAIIHSDGTEEYWVNGKRHRGEDLPAVIYPSGPGGNGQKDWFTNGVNYREGDKPSSTLDDGWQQWTNKKGQPHRDGGLPAVIHGDGKKEYWKNGKQLKDKTAPKAKAKTKAKPKSKLGWHW